MLRLINLCRILFEAGVLMNNLNGQVKQKSFFISIETGHREI